MARAAATPDLTLDSATPGLRLITDQSRGYRRVCLRVDARSSGIWGRIYPRTPTFRRSFEHFNDR